MFNISYQVAKSDSKNWSIINGYRPDDSAELALKGELLVLMSLATPISSAVGNIGKIIVDELINSYYFSAAYTTPLEQLEIAINVVWKNLDLMTEQEPKLRNEGVDLQAAVVIIREDVAYVGVVGEAEIDLLRDTKRIALAAKLVDPSGRSLLRTGSFKLDATKDVVVAYTAGVFKEEAVVELAQKLNLQDKKLRKAGSAAALIADEELIKQRLPQEELVTEETVIDDTTSTETPITDVAEENSLDVLPEEVNEVVETETVVVATNAEEPVLNSMRDGRLGNAASAQDKVKVAKAHAQKVGAHAKRKFMQFSEFIKTKVDREKLAVAKQNLSARVSKFINVDRQKGKTYQIIIANLIQNIRNLINRAIRFVRKEVMGIDNTRANYLQGRKPTRNWKLLAPLIIVVLIAGYVVINNALENRRQQQLRDDAIKAVGEIGKQVESIDAEVRTLLVSSGNETQRAELISTMQTKLTALSKISLTELKEKTDIEKSIDDIEAEVAGYEDKLRNVKLVTPTLITDLAVTFSGTELSDIEFHDNNLYVSDRANNVIYKVPATAGAQGQKLTGSDKLKLPLSISIDSRGDLIVVDEDPEASLATVRLADGSVTKHTGGLNIDNVGIASSLKAFKVGNEDRLYWIDTSEKQLKWVKRSPVGGYGSAPNIRRTDEDYADAVDLDIDGRIFVLNPSKGVLRYNAGGAPRFDLVPDNYTLAGMMPDDNLTGVSAMMLTGNLVYVADPANSRIVVLSKARNGNDAGFVDFQQQFVYRGTDSIFRNIKEIVIDKNNNLYVLDGTKIYQLKGLES